MSFAGSLQGRNIDSTGILTGVFLMLEGAEAAEYGDWQTSKRQLVEPGQHGSDVESAPEKYSRNAQADDNRELFTTDVESADWFVVKHQAQKPDGPSGHCQK